MFKKKEKTEKAPMNKKVRIMKVGTHKKSVLLLWAVLLASTSFGVYKNFTAIDTHTIHEKEIIQLRLNDTNQCDRYKCAGLECRTVWNGRFYRCLRSRSAGKRGRTDTGSHRKLYRDRSCR